MDAYLILIQKKVEYLQKRLVLLEQENRVLQKKNDDDKKEVFHLLFSFCDAFDNILPNHTEEAKSNLDNEFKNFLKRVMKLKRRFKSLMTSCGLYEIDLKNELDPKRARVVETKRIASCENGHILETVRSGYESSTTVYRPAEVIVVKNG